jgi:hypothetical protein
LKTDQVRKTEAMVVVKLRFLVHRVLGMRAAEWDLSWRWMWYMKVGIRRMERARRVRGSGWDRGVVVAVTVLGVVNWVRYLGHAEGSSRKDV